MLPYQNDPEYATHLDEADELKEFRTQFFIPQVNGKDAIYFTGNSLGLQPRTVSNYIQQELDDWARQGVEGHFHAQHPWLPYHELFPRQLGAIVGANENEVVVMNSLTVNLHLLMVSFYRPTKKRYRILCEAKAFPSDQYALESQAKFHGFDPKDAVIEIEPREGEHCLRTEDILAKIATLGDSLSVILIGAVNYYTGQFYDLEKITESGHAVGAMVGFDCAHAAGNVSLRLHDWNVDFACWCSYKYLNSGPGGVAGVYINEKHARNKDIPRLAGWWGYKKETRFRMEKGFEPIPTAEGWQLSNAPVLSMAVHKASLDIFASAGVDRLHAKRISMSAYMHYILNDIQRQSGEQGMEIITPAEEGARGCQVSLLMKKKGREVFDELTKNGVIADWREPNVIRVAPVPLYNTYSDIFQFGKLLHSILKSFS